MSDEDNVTQIPVIAKEETPKQEVRKARGRPRVGIGRYPNKQTLTPRATSVITEAPEFKSAVQAAVEKAVADVAKQLQKSREQHDSAPEGSDPTWMRALAMEISQLTDQGTGRKRVAPEILQARHMASERMVKLITDARAAKKTATYRVKAKTLLANRVVEPFWIGSDHSAQPTIIDWDGIPNEAMLPENKTAQAIYDAYKASLGSVERVIPEDALAITPGGLVVHGGAAGLSSGKRQVKPAEASQTGSSDGDESGLNIHHKNEPGRFVEKHILGSIATPARQTV